MANRKARSELATAISDLIQDPVWRANARRAIYDDFAGQDAAQMRALLDHAGKPLLAALLAALYIEDSDPPKMMTLHKGWRVDIAESPARAVATCNCFTDWVGEAEETKWGLQVAALVTRGRAATARAAEAAKYGGGDPRLN